VLIKVFPPKVKSRALDQFVFSEEASNYKSAEEFAEKLEEKFREDESKGWMFPTTAGVVKSQFPDSTLLIAAMGAIPGEGIVDLFVEEDEQQDANN